MSFQCSNRSKMDEQHPFGTAPANRFLRLSAQFVACAFVLAACGGGASEQTAAMAESGTTSPVASPAPVPAAVIGSATLSWVAPQTNADGTVLNDLAGYRIYYGTGSGNYSQSVTISTPSTTSYTVQDLSAATYFFVVRAFDKSNAESVSSPEVSKTIK